MGGRHHPYIFRLPTTIRKYRKGHRPSFQKRCHYARCCVQQRCQSHDPLSRIISQVICINSADGGGAISRYNPPPWSKSHNFPFSEKPFHRPGQTGLEKAPRSVGGVRRLRHQSLLWLWNLRNSPRRIWFMVYVLRLWGEEGGILVYERATG